MGRYRTLSRCPEPESYNDYYQKKDSTAMLKYARSLVNIHKPTDNFILCCRNTSPIQGRDCYIAVFQSYASLIKLMKRQASLDKCCTTCKDVPLTLMNGLKSEVCYDEFYKTVDYYSEDGCAKFSLDWTNVCAEKLGNLYPRGCFNNDCRSPNISLKRKLMLVCDKPDKCPTYVFCKCKENAASCKCCDYNVVFPYKNRFLSYSVSGCNNKAMYEFFNNPNRNPSKTFEVYSAGVERQRLLREAAIDTFSDYQPTFDL